MGASGDRFFVVTGGPGAGKTTLLRALAAHGLTCMEEAGRAIIRDQVAIGGTALPWADASAFAELMLAHDIRTYRRAQESAAGPILFDRGIPDVIGYRRLTGLPVPDHCMKAARDLRYHRCVFFAPPWPDIFAQDSERRQTLEDAEATFDAMMEVYEDCGYEAVFLPLDTVAVRAALVVETIEGCITPRLP